MNNLEEKVIKHDEQIKTLFNNVSELKVITTEISKLALNVEKLALNQTAMIEQQKSLKEDVDAIKVLYYNINLMPNIWFILDRKKRLKRIKDQFYFVVDNYKNYVIIQV